MTREYLVPLVTGLTLCQQKLGNTIIEPLGLISVHSLIFAFLFSAQSALFLKSNSKLPPSYSDGSFKETVTDNFLILPLSSGQLPSSFCFHL